MSRILKTAGIVAVLLGLSTNPTLAKKHSTQVNKITYHIDSHTSQRPDDIQPYRGYGVDVTDMQIKDGYLTVLLRAYQDRPHEVYIIGAYEGKDRTLKPLAFPGTIQNLREYFAKQTKDVRLNKKRRY